MNAEVLSTAALEQLRRGLDSTRYRLSHEALFRAMGPAWTAWHFLLKPTVKPPPAEAITETRRRRSDVLARDLKNVEDGYYPREVLFDIPLADLLKHAPGLAYDAATALWHKHRNVYADMPEDVDLDAFPSYYRRNFHWQNKGWLSEDSATHYDAQVEMLFRGMANVMRRMGLPALVDALRGTFEPRVLDVATGTGRYLRTLRAALPSAKLTGLDMSPYYVAHARRLFGDDPDSRFVAENAEKMSFADETFDAVTSIFLFHELPHDARRNVVREAFRVLRPGGTLMVCDSAQAGEDHLEFFLEWFPTAYHEPYFKGYVVDDLADMIEECGFTARSSETFFLSKVVVARKP